jgi:hypothetical protein
MASAPDGRIDEPGRRKPGFRGDVAVVLADGQEWFFPRPYQLYDPGAGDDEPVESVWSEGAEYGRLADRLAALSRQDGVTVHELMQARFAQLRFLLRQNYDLTPAEERPLLRLGMGPAVPADIRERTNTLFDLADGALPAPKAGGDGSGST